MVIKPSALETKQSLTFESNVISYGNQTLGRSQYVHEAV